MAWSARQWLGVPKVFACFNALVGASRARQILVRDYMRILPGERVLDIGCGIADVLAFFPSVTYTGFDISPSYVEQAKRRFPHAGTFVCLDVRQAMQAPFGEVDVVLATGVLHHLSDEEADGLFRLARRVLRPGGRLVTFDGCYVPGQSFWARRLLAADRGEHVRDEAGYRRLAGAHFSSVEAAIRQDLLRIPYTHLILRCTAA